MKIISSLAVLSLTAVSLPLETVAQSGVSADAFLSPTSFTFVNGVSDLRVAESYRVDRNVETTHILIEGLVPVEPGSSVVTSSYSGINLTSGEVRDVGQLYFTLPAGATSPGVASSPIVGIVPRAGNWDAFDPESPQTPLSGTSGGLQVNTENQTLGIHLGDYSGTANYNRVDNNTLEVEDFSLSGNGTTLEFYGAQFVRVGSNLYGIVQSKAAANNDTLMYEMRFSGLEDFDGDGVPDLLDTNTGSSFRPVINDYKYDRAIGWMYGADENWALASSTFNWVWTASYPWVYVPKEGWLLLAREISGGGGPIYIWHHERNEWVYTTEGSGGWFWKYDNSSWCHFYDEEADCG